MHNPAPRYLFFTVNGGYGGGLGNGWEIMKKKTEGITFKIVDKGGVWYKVFGMALGPGKVEVKL